MTSSKQRSTTSPSVTNTSKQATASSARGKALVLPATTPRNRLAIDPLLAKSVPHVDRRRRAGKQLAREFDLGVQDALNRRRDD